MAMRRVKLTVSEKDLSRFRDLVRERTGVSLPESRGQDLERAVRRSALEADVDDVGKLHELVSREGLPSIAFDALISALNLSETHFFRGSSQIQALEQRILPEVIERQSSERRLRIWSAGCSTGEEAYTLAILVNRLLPDVASWDVLILATDVNSRSLQQARRGVYGSWSLRGMPKLAGFSYLTRRGDRFEVVPRIRAMVTFYQLNLIENLYPSPSTDTDGMDLILCRNVLLYFDQEAARSVVRRLTDALVHGGWLMVSQVESGLGVFDGLAPEAAGTGAYRKLRPAPRGLDVENGGRPPASSVVEQERAGHRPARDPPLRMAGACRPPAPAAGGSPTACGEALQLWRAGLGEDALRLLEAEEMRDPLAATLHYLRGLILLDSGSPDEARAALRRCTCADPGFAPGHLAQASVFARLGLRDQAGIALQNAARLVAGLEPDDLVLEEDGLTVRDVLDLVTAQRELLGPAPPSEVRDG